MLQSFPWFQGELFGLIVDDLLRLPREPLVVADGFRLLPRRAELAGEGVHTDPSAGAGDENRLGNRTGATQFGPQRIISTRPSACPFEEAAGHGSAGPGS